MLITAIKWTKEGLSDIAKQLFLIDIYWAFYPPPAEAFIRGAASWDLGLQNQHTSLSVSTFDFLFFLTSVWYGTTGKLYQYELGCWVILCLFWVLLSFYCQLHTTYSHLRTKLPLRNCLNQIGLMGGRWGSVSIVNWCRRVWSAVDSTMSWWSLVGEELVKYDVQMSHQATFSPSTSCPDFSQYKLWPGNGI